MPRHVIAFPFFGLLALIACATSAPTPAPVGAQAEGQSGLVNPSPKDRECVAVSLRIPRRLAGVPMTLRAHLMVSALGEAHVVRVEGTEDHELADALARAVAACPFEPAKLYGEPIEAPYEVPLRFVASQP
jgi:hypothetical protein